MPLWVSPLECHSVSLSTPGQLPHGPSPSAQADGTMPASGTRYIRCLWPSPIRPSKRRVRIHSSRCATYTQERPPAPRPGRRAGDGSSYHRRNSRAPARSRPLPATNAEPGAFQTTLVVAPTHGCETCPRNPKPYSQTRTYLKPSRARNNSVPSERLIITDHLQWGRPAC